ncbi:MAG: MurR/RpiR family transcriptional regulator [Pseudomonadota bacterium]
MIKPPESFAPDTSQTAIHAVRLPRGVIDVIAALQSAKGTLSAGERRVAEYVEGHLARITVATIGEVAAAVGVSSPTVIRFCRSLGCEGFRDFKLQLVQNLAVSRQYLEFDTEWAPATPDGAMDQIATTVRATVELVREQLDPDHLREARDALLACRMLLAAGIGGGSSMLAREAANRLFRLGIPAVAESDGYLIQMRAATLQQGEVALLFSASGEAEAALAAARVAAGYGATVISVAPPGSGLSRLASIPIDLDLPEDADIFKPTASRYAHLMVLDALAIAVARGTAERTSDTLRRIRSSLAAFHGRTGPQPIGD